jgi:hypothetical protein
MSFLTSYVSAAMKNFHDSAVKAVAKWDPETVGEAQLAEWNNTAKEMAQGAAKAATDAKVATDAVSNITNNIARYTAAAEKLAATNEDAANKAADQAIEWQSKLKDAQDEAADATAWAAETLTSAQQAEKLVVEGRTKIEKAKRDQARAAQDRHISEQRLADRERMAGLTKNLTGTDVAIDAMAANARKDHEAAAASRIRSDVLGKSVDADAAINAALAEVDGGASKSQTLAEKIAALKSH